MKIVQTALLTLSSALLLSCGGGGSDGGLNDIFDDGATTATVQINNTTTRDVYELYFRDVHSSNWGNDMLSSDLYIPGNTRVNFTTTLCDRMIDVKAVNFLGDMEWLIPDVYING